MKVRKCKCCKQNFAPLRPLQMVCSYECSLVYMKQLSIKAENKKAMEQKKIIKEKVKTLSEYESEAKKVFQRFIRLRDEGKPCISCMKANPVDWAGGHYFPAGIYSGLIFDERNCHGQCNSYCNKYLSGNLINYRFGLINRFGEEFVKKLESDAVLARNYKWTKDELIAKKEEYEQKIKSLKKGS